MQNESRIGRGWWKDPMSFIFLATLAGIVGSVIGVTRCQGALVKRGRLRVERTIVHPDFRGWVGKIRNSNVNDVGFLRFLNALEKQPDQMGWDIDTSLSSYPPSLDVEPPSKQDETRNTPAGKSRGIKTVETQQPTTWWLARMQSAPEDGSAARAYWLGMQKISANTAKEVTAQKSPMPSDENDVAESHSYRVFLRRPSLENEDTAEKTNPQNVFEMPGTLRLFEPASRPEHKDQEPSQEIGVD